MSNLSLPENRLKRLSYYTDYKTSALWEVGRQTADATQQIASSMGAMQKQLQGLNGQLAEYEQQQAQAVALNNQIQLAQLQTEIERVGVQKEQLESQLRQENRALQESRFLGDENAFVKEMWKVTEDCKESLRSGEHFHAYVAAASGCQMFSEAGNRIAHSELLLQCSTLHDELVKLLDTVLSGDNILACADQGIEVYEALQSATLESVASLTRQLSAFDSEYDTLGVGNSIKVGDTQTPQSV